MRERLEHDQVLILELTTMHVLEYMALGWNVTFSTSKMNLRKS